MTGTNPPAPPPAFTPHAFPASTFPAATFPAGTFTPDPAPGRPVGMLLASAGAELRLTLRNGEQLLLAVVIPLAVLIGLTLTSFVSMAEPRVATVTPGVLTLAVLSTAFTSQAITTGFDRRYGVLKRLAAAGVGRGVLLAGKVGASTAVVGGQLVLLGGVALMLGWRPRGNPGWVLVLLALGIAALVALALVLGGTLRAEAVLALANLVWLVFVVVGGVIEPLTSAPGWLKVVGELTPAGALSDGLHAVLQNGHPPGVMPLTVLVCWAALSWVAVVRWFKWQ